MKCPFTLVLEKKTAINALLRLHVFLRDTQCCKFQFLCFLFVSSACPYIEVKWNKYLTRLSGYLFSTTSIKLNWLNLHVMFLLQKCFTVVIVLTRKTISVTHFARLVYLKPIVSSSVISVMIENAIKTCYLNATQILLNLLNLKKCY